MKRTILYAALFVALGAAALYALRLKKAEKGTIQSPDMEFAVKNTDVIHKIFIADRKGREVTLERKGDTWIYNGEYPARMTAIGTLLETLRRINVYYVPTKASEQSIIKSLAAEGLKVEVYGKDGNKLKVYYIGGVTNDETGTYAIMEGSEQPYVTHIPGFTGQLRSRFLIARDDWRSRHVFQEKPEEIQSISVEYPQRRTSSFRIDKSGKAEYSVSPFYSTTPILKSPLRKGVVEGYLLGFEERIAEAYETDNPARDSISAMVPFAIVSLKKTDGAEKKVTFWTWEMQTNTDGKESIMRFFTAVNNDMFVLTQYGVFQPIFRSYEFFFEGMPDRGRYIKK
jgi:Domain of unknown function (DUF4340)